MKYVVLTSVLLSSYALAATLSETPTHNALVVYNSNMALVHEERELKLTPNDTEIIYKDVAQSINPDSVHVTLDPSVSIFSQQYKYDKLTLPKLLQSSIDKPVTIRRRKNANEYQRLSATLLSANGNNAIVRTLDYKILSVDTKDILFDTIPKTLLTKPSLVWNINATQNLDTQIKLDYLIRNISFSSNYILNLHENSADLSGWITINNRSGKTFKDTELTLLAGDVNRVHQPTPRVMYKNVAMADAPAVRESSFEGYHLYTVPFKVNLANNEKTQIQFVDQKAIATQKLYEATLFNPLYLMGERKSDVAQFVSLPPLPLALPKGVIRTYGAFEGKNIFLGENQITHTPKNTPIKLKIGTNFDMKVKQTPLMRDDTKEFFDVKVRYDVQNHSDKANTITLKIPVNVQKDAKITTTQQYEIIEGNIAAFTLKVDANATKSFEVHFRSKR